MTTAPRPAPSSINGWSPEYVERLYERYRSDPDSLTPEERMFFAGFDLAMAGELKPRAAATGSAADRSPGASASPGASTNGTHAIAPPPGGSAASGVSPGLGGRLGGETVRAVLTPTRGGIPAGRASHFQAVVDDLMEAFRSHGHLAAKTDPFGEDRMPPESLSLSFHELTGDDLERPVEATGLGYEGEVPLREVVERLERTYCSTIGVEFSHIEDEERRGWLFERFESAGGRVELSRRQRQHLLELLTRSELFERFLGKRYPGEKRFSLEGAESLIPLLDTMLETATDLGVEEVVLGMAHRGRLNVLNNTLGKTYEQIFTEFEETWVEDYQDSGGDVKYHRGYSGTRRYPNGRMLHLAMASNPSHLEAVDPVVLGRCRAKQRLRNDAERSRVIPVLVHGDAAVVGQGVVAECLNYSELEGYTTGGTVHIVVNNQIGFTTVPEDGRSSRYCTDQGKAIDAPIFHVNGEDPEAVATVARFAMEYRQRFNRDVFVDLQCYRRYGHNEQDEASFTQPLLVKKIKKQKSVLTGYTERLLAESIISQADAEAIRLRLDEALNKAQAQAKQTPSDPMIDAGSARWAELGHAFSFDPVDTTISRERLGEICEALGRVPESFNLNRKLKPLLEARRGLAEGGEITHADAELLAFGSLLLDGVPVRLSGQDSRRGTFSQRHAVLRDSETGEAYTPLNRIREVGKLGTDNPPGSPGEDGTPLQAELMVYDSPLSEFGVLGFEYGYSLADPGMLTLWEAQFGDFVNGAQVVIDQFIASAEAKWDRWSGLVLLLPHGYEGQGPEHSSARLERFLQSCGSNNMQVVYPSTGPQAFHLLRRQLRRNFRKPLVVMTPKSMLRVPTGTVEELLEGSFREIIDDPRFERDGADRGKVERIVLCSGKLYHELAARRDANGNDSAAIVRIEQLYPFHEELFRQIRSRYPERAELVYAQEEPRNMGGYLHVSETLAAEVGVSAPGYIGRPASASPAAGSKRAHKREQERILTEAVGPQPDQQPDKQPDQQPDEPADNSERERPRQSGNKNNKRNSKQNAHTGGGKG